MSRRPGARAIKQELFLKCGKVDMYSMEKYSKEKLQLHHDPPYRLLSEKTHIDLHKLELDDREEYNRRMEIIRQNKKILERSRD